LHTNVHKHTLHCTGMLAIWISKQGQVANDFSMVPLYLNTTQPRTLYFPYSSTGMMARRSLCAYSAYWMVTNMGPVENMTVTYLDKCVRKDCSEYHALAEENNMALLTLAVAYNRDGCTGYIGISAMHHGGIIVLGGRKHGAVKIKAVMVLGGCQTNLQQSRKECLCGGCGPQTQEPRSCA